MQFKKRKKPGACDAMRCKEQVSLTFINGYDLCAKHFAEYKKESEKYGAPSGAIVTTADTSLPSEEVISNIVTPIKNETETMIGKLQTVEITSQAMLDTISKILQKVKADMKSLEEKRKSVTKPMLDAKKQIDAWFKPATDTLKEAERVIKKAIAVYIERQESEKLAALATGNTEALGAPAVMIPGGVQTRTIWKFRITDERLLPREYLCPDLQEIGRVVAEFKDRTNIPGVKAFTETSIAVKGTNER